MKCNFNRINTPNGKVVEKVFIENSRFMFTVNFAGDPTKDTFRSTERKANVMISEDFAAELQDAGIRVRHTKPNENDEVAWFVTVKLNFNSWKKPNVYLVSGENVSDPLNEDTIILVDEASVQGVNIVANAYKSERSEYKSLYIETMYVTQDVSNDPWYDDYHRGADDTEEVPFY